MNLAVYKNGWLDAGGKLYRAALGLNGVTSEKREGDKASPLGTYPIRTVFYRADRLATPQTALPIQAIHSDDGWCDDPADPLYNRLITRPYSARHEIFWREDHVYDLIVVLGYNDDPVSPGKGSAIFLHCARQDYTPTEGCAAVALPDLLEILAQISPDSTLTFLDRDYDLKPGTK